jgi:hypothetical protein
MTRLSERSVLSRLWIIGVLVVAAGLFSACSALRFAYNQAPEFVFWWADAYADFDDQQAPKVRDAIGQWFAWHRRSQLPDYARLLAKAQHELTAPTTTDKVCGWTAEIRQRAELAFAQALPHAAEVLPMLSFEQIQQIEHRQAKSNDDFKREYLQADPGERRKASLKRAVDRAETLYGRLDDNQRERLAQAVAASPFDPELWNAERRLRQAEALTLIRRIAADPPGKEATTAVLRAYGERLSQSPREPFRRYSERLEQYSCGVAAALHNSTSAAQRQHAVGVFKNWEADVRALMADSR